MRLLTGLTFLLLAAPVAAVELQDYLPEGVPYDSRIPTPGSVLGFEVGEWHVRHDQLVRYVEMLAEASPRVELIETGRTHEGRRLLLLAVSTPENIVQLEQLRQRHLREGLEGKLADGPLVIWQGFSVHGNESSGSNAALLLAYHLAAGGGAVEELLSDTVVLIDPSVNPDGLARFAQWANSHRSRTLVADPNNREHQEVWPGGRTNHYWFDLNRDWLLLAHPESRARVKMFHHWRPHVLTDFHEMGSDSTYFFQPGVPERRHPLTPERNQELTQLIGQFHARAMDKAGRLYYSEETFDDFYYGKGSTYPDVNGSVGILFEQASSRGHLMKTVHGDLDFPTTVGNQLRTALSTMEAADALRTELREWQAGFWTGALAAASKDKAAAYVIGDGGDPARAMHLIDILLRHDIEVHELAQSVSLQGRTHQPGHAWVIPLRQRQYRLAKAVMEYRTTFADETFYDVSAINMPSAFNLPFAALGGTFNSRLLGQRLTEATWAPAEFVAHPDAVAYAFDWPAYYAPRALQRLLAGEFAAYLATEPTTFNTSQGQVKLGRGAALIPLGAQARKHPATPGTSAASLPVDDRRAELEEVLRMIAEHDHIRIQTIVSGLTPEGVDLGSPSMRRARAVRPLLVVGNGVQAYEAGEVWHVLDTRADLPVTMVEADRLGGVDLRDYTHVILVNGSYEKWSKTWTPRFKAWIRDGGVLVATKDGAKWATKQGLHDSRSEEEIAAGTPDSAKKDEDKKSGAKPGEATEGGAAEVKKEADEDYRAYGSFDDDRAKRVIGGAIFEMTLDTTHPIGYGFQAAEVPVFRDDTLILERSENPYATVARYTKSPMLSGYTSEERLKEVAGSAAIVATRVGRGVVIRMVDNPNFRGIWYGTNKLFINSLFLGHLIDETELDPKPD